MVKFREKKEEIKQNVIAENFQVIHGYLQKAETVLQGTTDIKKELKEYMEEVKGKDDQLYTLLVGLDERDRRREDQLLVNLENGKEEKEIMNKVDINVGEVFNGVKRIVTCTESILDGIKKLKEDVDVLNKEKEVGQVELSEQNAKGMIKISEWMSSLQINLEE
jgi:hypothetical protein